MFLDFLKPKTTPFHMVNTGTLFDLATGSFILGADGRWILDGGLSQTVGIMGRGQTYKTNIAGSLVARALSIYPDAAAYVYDSESFSIKGKDRYTQFLGGEDGNLSDRILYTTVENDDLTSFADKFKQIIKARDESRKKLMVESPFVDPDTGKAARIWQPLFIIVDSYSAATCSKADTVIAENDIDSSAMNTLAMTNGRVKTDFFASFLKNATSYGIYGIFTAHVGDKIDMNSFMPTPKQMQMMKQNDKLKNVGSNFTFLTSCLIQTTKAAVRLNSSKGCEYPQAGGSSDKEVNEISTMIVRNKNNASGLDLSYLVSQSQGILDSVTNFEFVRGHKNFGLTVKGNNTSFGTIFNKDKTFTKVTLRKDSHDEYELKRALEIIAQLCFIKYNWDDKGILPSLIKAPIEVFAELLSKVENTTVNRILNSTGVWSLGKQERERLTIVDILAILAHENQTKNLGIKY